MPSNVLAPNVIELRARLDETALRTILDQLLPLTILLDDGADGGRSGKDGRWVQIDPTRTVDFVEDRGLRLVTSGRIRWITAGVPIEVGLHSAEIILRPEIEGEGDQERLVFRPELASADLKNVPALFDRGVVALVNRKLSARAEQIAWDYQRSLALVVPMPAALDGVASLRLSAGGASVRTSSDALELTLPVALQFVKASAPAAADEPDVHFGGPVRVP
jgi:hypothetical protein